MIRAKRYLRTNKADEEKTKKFKCPAADRKLITSFENLPNEIYYEIFEYLEGCQLYEAFSNLNQRFENILNSSALLLKIHRNFYPETVRQNQISQIINLNNQQILSIKWIYSFNDISTSNTLFSFSLSFTRLESLSSGNIPPNELIPLLLALISLPRLFSLTIYSEEELDEINNIYQIIFNLPVLKYNKLTFFGYEISIPLSIATNNQFSRIEYLIIDHCCAFNELIVIISYTPQLKRLSCERIDDSNETLIQGPFNLISNLKCISIRRFHAEFDRLETLLTKITHNLEILRITCSGDVKYLDADRWERIISEHLTDLRIFEFKYEEIVDEDLVMTNYHGLVNRFNSSFWVKRNWLFRIYIDSGFWVDNLIYSICPYKKNPDNFHECPRNDDNSQSIILNASAILSEMNQLIVIDHLNIDDDQLFTQILGPILAVQHITCLNVQCRNIFIGTLINLIRYLPNLDTLVVSSLSMGTYRYLTVDETRNLRLISSTNKIAKVRLHQMTDLAQGHFLLRLCPSIRYFEIDCAHGVTPETFIRFILMKSIKCIPNLSSLCLEITETNENILEKVKKMIVAEQLRQNYTIKQIGERLYFQWN